METRTWTNFVNRCSSCHRNFRISREALDEAKRDWVEEGEAPVSDQEAAESWFDICLGCADAPAPGEYDVPGSKKWVPIGRTFLLKVIDGDDGEVLETYAVDPAAVPTEVPFDFAATLATQMRHWLDDNQLWQDQNITIHVDDDVWVFKEFPVPEETDDPLAAPTTRP